jgi:hypothetical protein
MPDDTITGTVVAVRDCGAIALLFLDAGEGRIVPVPLDHRTFRRLLDGEGCSSTELVGRGVSFAGDLVTFLD